MVLGVLFGWASILQGIGKIFDALVVAVLTFSLKYSGRTVRCQGCDSVGEIGPAARDVVLALQEAAENKKRRLLRS